MKNDDHDFIGMVIVILMFACGIGICVAVYERGFEEGAKAVHQ